MEKKHRYFRVIVKFANGETSAHRVFKDRRMAERYAARYSLASVVKKVSVQEFVREPQIERRVFKGRRSGT